MKTRTGLAIIGLVLAATIGTPSEAEAQGCESCDSEDFTHYFDYAPPEFFPFECDGHGCHTSYLAGICTDAHNQCWMEEDVDALTSAVAASDVDAISEALGALVTDGRVTYTFASARELLLLEVECSPGAVAAAIPISTALEYAVTAQIDRF